MHRFRKKSDPKRAQVPEHLLAGSWSPQPPLRSNQPPDNLPALPPASDFRTSLILPSLSRRFTLLRTSDGAPVSLDDMRSRFAEQRAKGAEHQISEEEEDMIVQALGQLHANDTAGLESMAPTPNSTAAVFSPGIASTFATQQDLSVALSASGDSDYPASIRSGIASSVASSPSPTYPRSMLSSPATSRTSSSPRYSSKRNSNNMFGSGRFHDTSYLRSVSKASSRSTTSLAASDSHGGSIRSARSAREAETDSGRPVTPDTDAADEPAAPSEKSSRMWPVSPHSSISALPPRLSKEFTVQQARRTSLALEQVIRGIEEEAEETIVVPRRSLSRAGTVNSRPQSPQLPHTSCTAGTPVAWMTDEARVDDRDDEEPTLPLSTPPTSSSSSASPPSSPSPRPGTTSPTPRLPGYIPGMARPLTPRDVDSDRDDGATGYSTTPRARSPAQPYHSHFSNHSHGFSYSRHHHNSSMSSDGLSILPPSILRRGSGSTQLPPMRTTSPGFGGRTRGNSTSSPPLASPVPSPIPEERFKIDHPTRRPLSPLIGTVTGTAYGGSRPGTPSGAGTWAPSSPLAQVHTIPPGPPRESGSPRPDPGEHSRNGSLIGGKTSFVDVSSVMPPTGPVRPDSPLIDGRHESNASTFSTFGAWEQNQIIHESRNGYAPNGGNNEHGDSSIANLDIGRSSHPPRPTAAGAKIAARAPTPVHTRSRSPTASESAHGHEPMLLHRTVSKRSQKRIRSPTPPHTQSQAQTPLALHTPSSSSNSSSNVNLGLYSNTSPLFSPILNTSASSLLSVGSSYHSWAGENGKKNGWDQLVEYDSQRSAWQDILNSSSSGANETDDASETHGSAEQVLHSLTGLTKVDLVNVQTRLVADALTRKGFEPPRSPTRRRRISVSRASFSARESGANSPAPPFRQATPLAENGPTSPLPTHSPDNTSRANALLDSVLNSIQSQSVTSTPSSSDGPTAEPHSSADGDSSSKLPSLSSNSQESAEDDASALRLKAITDALAVSDDGERRDNDETVKIAASAPEPSPPLEEDSGEATEVPNSHAWRSPPSQSQGSPNDTGQLAREVSRKAAAATAALKSPSQLQVGESDVTVRRRPTKRIDLQTISNPQLVSSSTSVNAIPITQQSPAQRATSPTSDSRSSSKFSQHFKKLRGSLRSRPSTRDGEEVTPSSLSSATGSLQSPHSAASSDRYIPSPIPPPQTLLYPYENVPPGAISATESRRFKVPIPSPPASAGPGLKGFFISRFRKPKKGTVNPGDLSRRHSPESMSPISPPHERAPPQGHQRLIASPPGNPRLQRSRDRDPIDPNRPKSPSPDPEAVNQLRNAATELGLDQSEINALLERSISTSRAARTQASTSAIAGGRSNSTTSRPPVPRREGPSLELSRTPDQPPNAPARPNALVNRQPESEIVRRTIIFASDNPELAALVAGSGRPQRSTSVTSIHSIGSATHETLVPRLPSGLERTHASKPSDSSSFFEAHSQEQDFSGVQNGTVEGTSVILEENVTTDTPPEEGHGSALEVLQLSNGQVVWSVLDSLRAEEEDDSQSLFRRSMASSRGNDVSDDLEVRFKEHKRWPSKGSNYSQGSLTSRRRPALNSSDPRPETKLFKTNSLTIGRLIEDLSKNKDSGSFNFLRQTAGTHSSSTSFHSDTSGPSHQVERDLEALLNIINPPR